MVRCSIKLPSIQCGAERLRPYLQPLSGVCLSKQKRVVIQKLKSKESTDIMKLWLGNSCSFSVHSIAVP